jgi:acetyl esterase
MQEGDEFLWTLRLGAKERDPMSTLSLRARIESFGARRLLALPAPILARIAGAPVERDGAVLDRQVQIVLALARIAGKKPAHERGVEGCRRDLEESGLVLAPAPAPVMRQVRDVRLPGGVRARLYVPPRAPGVSSALVYFHGGGFVAGDIASHDVVCREIAERASVRVLSVDYRRAPEHRFPAAAVDAEAAFRWAVNEASSLGIDPLRIAVGGDSAGGNLAAVVSLALRGARVAPAAQLLVYPVVDLTMSFPSIRSLGRGFLLEEASIRWYRDQYVAPGQDLTDPRLSPYFAPDLAGAAPAIVVTAGFDPLRDEAEAYAEKLTAAGVRVIERRYASLFHGFVNTTGVIRAARTAMAEIARDLEDALR